MSDKAKIPDAELSLADEIAVLHLHQKPIEEVVALFSLVNKFRIRENR